MRAYPALYVVVFMLSALIAYTVLSYSYAPISTVTVTSATTRTITEIKTYVVPTTLYERSTTTVPKVFEIPRACSIARPTTTEIPAIERETVTETTIPLAVGAVRYVASKYHSETIASTETGSSIEIRKPSEKGMVRAYSVSRGIVKLLNANIEFATVSQNRSYAAIDILLSASMPSKAFVVTIYVEPLPLPFGWNGSSWVIEFDEKHCLRRLSALPPYSYRVEPRVIELEPGKACHLHIELLFHGPIYGRYILVVRLSTGDTLELRFASPNYRDPTTPPPRELVELAKICGYSVGG